MLSFDINPNEQNKNDAIDLISKLFDKVQSDSESKFLDSFILLLKHKDTTLTEEIKEYAKSIKGQIESRLESEPDLFDNITINVFVESLNKEPQADSTPSSTKELSLQAQTLLLLSAVTLPIIWGLSQRAARCTDLSEKPVAEESTGFMSYFSPEAREPVSWNDCFFHGKV